MKTNDWVEWKKKHDEEKKEHKTLNQKMNRLITFIYDMEANNVLGYKEAYEEAFHEAIRLAEEIQEDIRDIPDFYTG